MRIFQRSYTKPLPAGAKILRRRCGKVAQFYGRGGRVVEAKLTEDSNRVLCQSEYWFIEFADGDQIVHPVRACTEEAPTRELADKINVYLSYRAVDKAPPVDLMQWFAARPLELRNELVKAGIVPNTGQDAGPRVLVLTDLIQGFERYLRAEREASEKYVKGTVETLRRVFLKDDQHDGLGFLTWDDIDRQKVRDFLLSKRDGGKGISKRTFNSAVQALKHFCEWVCGEYEQIDASPLHKLQPLDKAETDRRRLRRAMVPEDCRKLLEAAAAGPEREGMDGQERALLYRFILETGLRANECRTLLVSDIRVEDPKHPYVVVRAGNSKHRKDDVVPLRPELSAALQSFVAQRMKLPTARMFGGRYKKLSDHACDALQADLQAAGLPYQDDRGEFFDLHSGRHTFVTRLGKNGGLDVDTVRKLARHANVSTTQRYMHTLEAEKRAGLDCLPDYTQPTQQARANTRNGTDNRA
jgi:integrase